MGYLEPEWERAMKVHEVLARALSGEIHWFLAADILGMSPRTLRRWREGFERYGYSGLLDLRRRPAHRDHRRHSNLKFRVSKAGISLWA